MEEQRRITDSQDFFFQNLAQLISTLNMSVSKMMLMIDEVKDLNSTLSRIETKLDLIHSNTVNEIDIKPRE